MEFIDGSYEIIGAALEVHRILGCGFTEPVYQEALGVEFNKRRISFQREVPIVVTYKDVQLGSPYKADFIVNENVVVELKAVSTLVPAHHSQVLNYLNATGFKLGLLINFGAPSLEYKRLILTRPNKFAKFA